MIAVEPAYRRLLCIGLWLLVASMAAPLPAAQAAAPAATVERLHSALLEVMQNADTLGYEGRRERLAPVIRQSFDQAFICEIILGRRWESLSGTQRQRMIDTFTRLTIATYASRFDGFSGESFETVAQEPLKRERMLVRSRLVRPEGEPIPLDYVLQESDDGWRIVNVVADGVSDLSLKRADYGSIMKREGFAALIGRLEGQIADMESGG